jgi:hypothetical protein
VKVLDYVLSNDEELYLYISTVNNSNKHRHYSEYCDDWCIKRVSKIYKKDLDLLGYKFGK